MLNRKVLANSTAGNVLRLVPPLNISYDKLEVVLNVLVESIKELKKYDK
jgi:acetylornithine/N-succinyldiaminopimelate aminotransferase